jgi:predicted kinase
VNAWCDVIELCVPELATGAVQLLDAYNMRNELREELRSLKW